MKLRWIPGAVSSRSLRGLVIVDTTEPIELRVSPEGATVAVARVAVHSNLEEQLKPLQLWKVEVAGLANDTLYQIDVAIKDEPAQRFVVRTLDRYAQTLKFVAASCFYDGFGAGTAYSNTLAGAHCKDARFKILLGDNVYLDVHPGQASYSDAWMETSDRYKKYYWNDAGNAQALSTLPTLLTWDDHEIWNNAPESQIHLSRTRGRLRDPYLAAARAGVEALQAPLNPPPVSAIGQDNPKSYRVDELPLIDLFALDARMNRTVRGDKGRLATESDIQAVCSWLRGLKRPGILAIGQPLICDTGGRWSDYWPADFPSDFERIWAALYEAEFDVAILTGDVHHSRVDRFVLGKDRQVFEIVTSPASHIPTGASVAFGDYGTQGRGEVEFPEKPKIGLQSLAFGDYYFGTDVRDSIAAIELRARGDAAVEIGCTFLDLRTGTVAPAVSANRGWFRRGRKPALSTCDSSGLFTLRKRAPL